MTEFKPEYLEAAKWGQVVDATAKKFVSAHAEVMADAAGRGFAVAPGATLKTLQEAAQAVKAQLTDANAKLFEEQIQRLIKENETEQKWVFGLAKLDTEAYKADLQNALLLEKAEDEYTLDERKALIEEMKSDVEKRQAAIIEEKADIEHEVNYWKLQAILAEDLALDAEVQLAREKIKTAEEKAKVIAVLYEVIAAEQLVLIAEQRRAAALQRVVTAETEVAEIQKTMIPYMVQKADARILQAEVIKEEAEAKKQIEELGYRRIELKEAQEDAEHQLRVADLALEQARKELTTWDRMTDLARNQSRRAIQDYENIVKKELLPREETLKQKDKRFDVARRLFYQNLEARNNISLLAVQRNLAIREAQAKIANIVSLNRDKVLAVSSTSKKTIVRTSHDTMYHYITGG